MNRGAPAHLKETHCKDKEKQKEQKSSGLQHAQGAVGSGKNRMTKARARREKGRGAMCEDQE